MDCGVCSSLGCNSAPSREPGFPGAPIIRQLRSQRGSGEGPWDSRQPPRSPLAQGGAVAGGWLALWVLGPARGLEGWVPRPSPSPGSQSAVSGAGSRCEASMGGEGRACQNPPPAPVHTEICPLRAQATSRQDRANVLHSGSVIPEIRARSRSEWPIRFFFLNKPWFSEIMCMLSWIGTVCVCVGGRTAPMSSVRVGFCPRLACQGPV